MDKEQWQKLYDDLDKIHSDFVLGYPDYKNGRNKKKRDAAKREVDNAIRLADRHIRENGEAYNLLTGGDRGSEYSRAIDYDEFRQPQHFGGDLKGLLDKIQEIIDSEE